jgi:uncharacterized protein YbjT (DUF2867 family)
MRNGEPSSSTMRNKTATMGLRLLLAGATGLVGQAVLREALADPRIARVVAPTRRALRHGAEEEKSLLFNPVVDFEHLPSDAEWWNVDAVVCTLGTTIAKAGSQPAFRKVDHDYVVAVARLARAHGARSFALTSAAGADPASRIFYSRTKGDAEASVRACGFPSLTIVRPGLIGGAREESRPAEFAAKLVLGAIGRILPRRLRINTPERIAHALLDAALRAAPGSRIITSEELV